MCTARVETERPGRTSWPAWLPWVACLCYAVAPAAAQSAADFAIINARVFDGFVVHDSASVVSRDGRVVGVLDSGTVVPPDITVIDAGGKTVIPGLINAHVHAQGAPENLKEAAEAGVLTVIDLFNLPDNARRLRGYRGMPGYAELFSAGSVATPPGGHGTQYGFPIPTLTEPSQADQFVQDRLAEGSEFLKIIIEGRGGATRLPNETTAALAAAARRRGLISVAHVSTFEDAMVALDAGVAGLAHLWFDRTAALSDAELARFVSREFFITPTVVVWERAQQTLSRGFDLSVSLANVKRLHDHGVTILAGTDPRNAGINFGTDLYEELLFFERAALTPTEVLKTATSNVAARYGLRDRGSIEPGKRADLLLIDGDPTAAVSAVANIVGIWQAGVRIK